MIFQIYDDMMSISTWYRVHFSIYLSGFSIWGIWSHVHTKTLEACKKSLSGLIYKVSSCLTDCTSKTMFFYLSLSIKHKDLTRRSGVFICYFIGSVVKIVLLYFLYTKDNRLRLKRNMNDGTNVFLTSLLTILTWNILLLVFLIQDNFMF